MSKPTSICIVCPIYDKPTAAYFESMLRLMSTGLPPHQVQFQPQYGEASVGKSRDELASWFLRRAGCEWLLMTDADIQFTAEDIRRLVGRDRKLIGGLYHKRRPAQAPQYVLNPLPGRGFDPAAGEVQEVRYVGTGFMLIHRSVLERMRDEYPEIEYVSDHQEGSEVCWQFFPEVIRDRRRLSEDWAFCQRWLDMGGKIHVDCGRKLPHHGTGVY